MHLISIPIAVALAACGASAGHPRADAPPDAPRPESPPAGDDLVWSMSSPDGIQQLPEEDVATTGPLRLAVRGFDQIATAASAEGAELRIVPHRDTHAPLRLLAEPTGTRSLIWMLTPLGVLWHNPIVWDDGTTDADGRLLYRALEGGVLDATWTRPPAGASLAVELSVPPITEAAAVYRIGALRIRVVAGTPVVAGRVLSVTPAAGRLQVVVYTDALYDAAAIDAAGALRDAAPGRVAEQGRPVARKHVRLPRPTRQR